MTRFIALKACIIGGLILGFLFCPFMPLVAADQGQPIAIITSPVNTGIGSLTLEELKAVYLKRLQEVKGVAVVPIQRKAGSDLRKAFERLVLKSDEDQLKNFWIEEKLAGRESPPKTFDSFNSILAYLKKVPGTISYVPLAELEGERRKEVFIVPLKMGKRHIAPEEEAYPLRF